MNDKSSVRRINIERITHISQGWESEQALVIQVAPLFAFGKSALPFILYRKYLSLPLSFFLFSFHNMPQTTDCTRAVFYTEPLTISAISFWNSIQRDEDGETYFNEVLGWWGIENGKLFAIINNPQISDPSSFYAENCVISFPFHWKRNWGWKRARDRWTKCA